jgi:hypothetical protein
MEKHPPSSVTRYWRTMNVKPLLCSSKAGRPPSVHWLRRLEDPHVGVFDAEQQPVVSPGSLVTHCVEFRVGKVAKPHLHFACCGFRLYWQIGRDILTRQEHEGWGTKVIDRLATDLRRAYPEMTGLSPRNLKYMRAFAQAWPEERIVQAPLAQMDKGFRIGTPMRKPLSIISNSSCRANDYAEPLPQSPTRASWNKPSGTSDRGSVEWPRE